MKTRIYAAPAVKGLNVAFKCHNLYVRRRNTAIIMCLRIARLDVNFVTLIPSLLFDIDCFLIEISEIGGYYDLIANYLYNQL